MPTVKEMHLPKPKSWQDFETIVADACGLKWGSTSLQKNGRNGQKQNGVDIFGPDDLGRPVGIQCKRFQASLTLDTIESEIAAAEKFSAPLVTLYVACTGDFDAPLQQKVRLLSDRRVAQGKFSVALIFWDDIVNGLVLNPAVFKSHYPQITLDTHHALDKERFIAALEIGYYGADLWSYILLIYGEVGQMVQADPDELFATLPVISRRVKQLLSPADSQPILESIRAIAEGCAREKISKEDWDSVKDHANRIQTRLRRASSLLPLQEGNVLELGLQLGHIYHHMDDIPTLQSQTQIRRKVANCLPSSSEVEVNRTFSEASERSSGYDWAKRIYLLLDREFRYSA